MFGSFAGVLLAFFRGDDGAFFGVDVEAFDGLLGASCFTLFLGESSTDELIFSGVEERGLFDGNDSGEFDFCCCLANMALMPSFL